MNLKAINFPEPQSKQSLYWSSHVLSTRHSNASVYPTLTKCVSTSDHHHDPSLGIHNGFLPCPVASWMLALIPMYPTTFFWLIRCMASLTIHWSSSLPKASTIRRSPLNLVSRHHIYFCILSVKEYATRQPRDSFTQSSWSSSPRLMYPVPIVALGFSSPLNLGVTFL
jgi:hypothetical protein